MRLILSSLVVLCTGCATVSVPIGHALPTPPQVLLERCPDLALLPDKEEKLSEFVKVVTQNYTLYHECGAKHEILIKWYQEQKQIHDAVFNKK